MRQSFREYLQSQAQSKLVHTQALGESNPIRSETEPRLVRWLKNSGANILTPREPSNPGKSKVNKRTFYPALLQLIRETEESHVDRSVLVPEEFVRTNVHGTLCLLNETRNLLAMQNRRFASCMSQPTRSTAHWSQMIRLFMKEHSTRPQPLFGQQSSFRSPRACLSSLVRTPGPDYELFQQLPPCQFPEKLIPLVYRYCAIQQGRLFTEMD